MKLRGHQFEAFYTDIDHFNYPDAVCRAKSNKNRNQLVTFTFNIMKILEPFEDHFWEFYNDQTRTVQEKIDYVLQIVISMERIPRQFFKHLEDGIYEIRVKVRSDIYRIFCFFEEGRVIILLHAFQKKSRKIPGREIERAKRLRTEYYENKNNQ